MKPFYRYLGGKSREIKFFADLIPKDYSLYVEPFFGGGAVFWALEPEKAVINDNDQSLMKFLEFVKLCPEVFEEVSTTWPCTKENFLRLRNDFIPSSPKEEVQRYFYFLRTSFNGCLRFNQKKGKYNMSFGNKTKIPGIPESNIKLLQNTIILSKDYTEIFELFDGKDSFFFLDPPYDGLFSYLNDSNENKVITKNILLDLSQKMKECKSRCLLTVNDTPYTRQLFEGMITRTYSTKLTFGAHCKGKNLEKSTLVVTNYSI